MTDREILSVKMNTLGLATKNITKWAKEFLLEFQYPLNLSHWCRMWRLDSIGYELYRHLNSFLEKNLSLYLSRSSTVDFVFIFSFSLFSIFRTILRLGSISHTVTSVTNWWQSHKTDHETWENGVEGSRTKWRHTAWTTYAGLMLYSWSFRVGCTVANTDHG